MRSLIVFALFILNFGFLSCKKTDTGSNNQNNNNSGPDTIGHNIQLFGLKMAGGVNRKGSIFKINADGTDYTTLLEFNDTTGYSPQSALVKAPNGKLYGTCIFGGTNGRGTMFSYDPNGTGYHKIVDFYSTLLPNGTWQTNGNSPNGTLMVASDGLLYGTAGSTIISINPVNDLFSVLAIVPATIGGPTEKLLQGANGKLYGLANSGPSGDTSCIFSYDINSHVIEKLYNFVPANGIWPQGFLSAASDGNFYGTTSKGGNNDRGVIFRFNPTNNQFSKLIDFSEAVANNSSNGFVQANGNNLFGNCPSGSTYGTLYHFDIVSAQLTVDKTFGGLEGADPAGTLLLASNNYLYGMQSIGGQSQTGCLFRFSPDTYEYKRIADLGTSPAEGNCLLDNSLIEY
ncbi:MAG: choice-of-anchor tandem repeat GloVer-containing protein [Ferruginibacter sp.]